jgi:hypothetical protein
MILTDGEGIHDVEFVLVNRLSSSAENSKEENMAAEMTAAAPCGHWA